MSDSLRRLRDRNRKEEEVRRQSYLPHARLLPPVESWSGEDKLSVPRMWRPGLHGARARELPEGIRTRANAFHDFHYLKVGFLFHEGTPKMVCVIANCRAKVLQHCTERAEKRSGR